MVGADGTGQATTRLEDGSYRAVLADGTEIVTAPDGSQVVTAPDGSTTETTMTDDGWVAQQGDGTTVTSSMADDGSTEVAYDYEAGAGGISSIARNPGEGTMQVVLGNGVTLDITVEDDGSIIVVGPGFERTFDPGSGIAGRVQTALAEDGSTTVSTESGTTSTVSADGSTMTVESSDGSTAVAVKDSGGVTVDVDGVTYTYSFD
jgi:hypothetical protein